MHRSLISLVAENPFYRQIFDRARRSRRRVTSVYDISTRCNLFCEGCLCFDRDGGFGGRAPGRASPDLDGFFGQEHARGVTYPQLAGAEPSLEQKTLHLAARYWKTGMVHTNGIRAIDRELPFRLYISVWGGRELTRKWRGADCYEKTLNTAQDDPRAIINYTINSQNIEDILPVALECSDRGLQMTFQIYSPTSDYLDYLSRDEQSSHTYIRGADTGDNLQLGTADLARAEAAVIRAMDRFPQTIIFTHALARWLFAAPETFPDWTEGQPAPSGCFAGNDPRHRHYQPGQVVERQKTCGHPSVDCRTCKLYTTIYPAFFADKLSGRMSRQDAVDFLDAHNAFHIIYEGHRDPVEWRVPEPV